MSLEAKKNMGEVTADSLAISITAAKPGAGLTTKQKL